MTETAAREQVLEAGLRLVREGLIERTWGNISARVSDTAFVITPSGLPYEDLRPEQLAVVNIADGSHSGTVKPSSEKGIHADAYRLRPEVRFVIHTHQRWASVAGTAGRALTGFIHPDLGKRVPCAAYGLPGTGRLLISSISTRDFPVVGILILYITFVVIFVYFLVGLLYKVVDPRIS